MHDVRYLVENLNAVKENLSKRQFDVAVIDLVAKLNDRRKKLIQFVEGHRAQIKKMSKSVGALKKEGKDASSLVSQVQQLKDKIEESNKELEEVEKKQHYTLSMIPNLLDEDVPTGESEEDNVVIKTVGKIPKFDFTPKDHVDLGEALGMLDFEKAASLTGSRFAVYKKDLARLERALINFMIDDHVANGYEEIIPPFLANSETMFGSGQLPKFEHDLFKIQNRDWYLIPTAEVPLANLKSKEIFSAKELPLKYCAYTPCFRSEAGSHGKDTRGLIRLHQFNKVELVNIVTPETSAEYHQEMVDRAANILEKLELPYRLVTLCSADVSFGARKCIDLEVWIATQNCYREISSISNCGDFQARRGQTRFRDESGKATFPHILNGSGLAIGRTLVAIMENFQQEDGTIAIPKCLHDYMGGMKAIGKR